MPVRDRIYKMLEQGLSDAVIRRRAHITETSLGAYKAHYTRKQHGQLKKSKSESRASRSSKPSPLEGTDATQARTSKEEMRDYIVRLLERKIPYEEIYQDTRFRKVSRGTITAYIANWSRGSYKK